MQSRRIGDAQVGAIGLGTMPMSIEGRPDESRAVATIHAALDSGVTLIDTADAYHIGADEVGHGESLVAKALATYGIAFLPWSPLGGIGRAGELGTIHAAFRRVAQRYGVSAQQVCLAWMLAKSPIVIPIPGASRPETIRDSAAAPHLTLADGEIADLDATRYAA